MDNINCNICLIPLDDTKITLLCNHQYHYNCIKNWYKTIVKDHSIFLSKTKICPYCRKNGGYLPKPENEIFDPDIHDVREKKCKAQLKKSNRLCSKNAVKNGYCNIHNKL